MAIGDGQGVGGGTKPIVLTVKQIHQVESLAGVLNQVQLSDFLGIHHETFREICKRQPDVDRAYKLGRSSIIKDLGSSLVEKARGGDLSAQIFYLKTQAGWRETDNVTVSDQNGAPTLNIVVQKEPK